MPKYNVGIDVGMGGAIAILEKEQVPGEERILETAHIYDMPEKHNFRDIEKILIAIPNDEVRVIIEAQNPFPGQGVKSVYSLGWQVGYLNALLDYLKMPYEEVRSATWMKFYGLKGKKHVDGKQALFNKAQKLYPYAELRGPKGALKDGRVDALLIAHYCKRLYP
jgi:hypothetical protein